VEGKSLVVWTRRGGTPTTSILLREIVLLKIVPEEVRPRVNSNVKHERCFPQHYALKAQQTMHSALLSKQGGVGCVLQVHASSKSGSQEQTVISLQARSRRETNLWGEILQVIINMRYFVIRLISLRHNAHV
jgi:hypothetical protein